jgi:lysophospholipase L1-like esterase
MKTILCFGDSNTWGFDPATKERFPHDVRWPGVLRRELGAGWWVIEEGLNGRTTVFDDPIEPGRCGRAYLVPCLNTHRPLEMVILFLGVNDVKLRFSASAYDIGQGMAELVEIALKSEAGPRGGAPKVLVVAPPPLRRLTEFAETFDGGADKSKRLAGHYRRVAEEYLVEFFDAAEAARLSDIDGIHFEAGEHLKLGKAVAERARLILG